MQFLPRELLRCENRTMYSRINVRNFRNKRPREEPRRLAQTEPPLADVESRLHTLYENHLELDCEDLASHSNSTACRAPGPNGPAKHCAGSPKLIRHQQVESQVKVDRESLRKHMQDLPRPHARPPHVLMRDLLTAPCDLIACGYRNLAA